MEKVTTKQRNYSFYKKIVLSILKNFSQGRLTITFPDGEMIQVGDSVGTQAHIAINNEVFFKKVALYGDVGFGESYCDGDWSTPNLVDVISWAIDNVEKSGVMSGSEGDTSFFFNAFEKVNRLGHIFKRNNLKNSKDNISFHYDLSNKFYEMMLDSTMSYSCGIFEDHKSTLEEAQLNKLKHLCLDLDIQPGDHILEIGCGWGGFAEYAATHYDCKVTGITISKEQYAFALDRIRKSNLTDKVEILLIDYRELNGKYDKVVSVEMIEAVGDQFLGEYFKTIDQLLKPTGVAVIQAITSPDSRYNEFKNGVDFIQKHIFPGSLLPSINSITDTCTKNTTLHLYNLRDIGLHYSKTLRLWREAVDTNKVAIAALGMDENFFRKWNYYLCYCEAAFAKRNISTVQVTLIKPNNTDYKYSVL